MLIVDLDTGYVSRCQGDEDQILPQKVQKALMTSLKQELGEHSIHIDQSNNYIFDHNPDSMS